MGQFALQHIPLILSSVYVETPLPFSSLFVFLPSSHLFLSHFLSQYFFCKPSLQVLVTLTVLVSRMGFKLLGSVLQLLVTFFISVIICNNMCPLWSSCLDTLVWFVLPYLAFSLPQCLLFDHLQPQTYLCQSFGHFVLYINTYNFLIFHSFLSIIVGTQWSFNK